MSDRFTLDANPWLLPMLAVLGLLLVWLAYRFFVNRAGNLERALSEISFDRLQDLVIPKADEGEIVVDYVLLTSQGLLILDIKNVEGTVFGGDKMQDWTVMAEERRYTFPNPQPALYDRIAAVRQIVRQVPVAGRILFSDDAAFTKGVPAMVCNLKQLVAEFGEPDNIAANSKVDAFKPHWDLIVKHSVKHPQAARR